MRKILFLVWVGACLPPPSTAPCDNSGANTCGPQGRDPERVDIPRLNRRDLVVGDGIAGLTFKGASLGAASWKMLIKNDSSNNVSLLWDESSFVGANGTSGGRLIPGETKMLDIAKAHPPTPLPPHASVVEVVLIEKLVDEEHNEEITPMGGTIGLRKMVEDHRAQIEAFLLGGHMNIALAFGSERQMWTGTVERADADVPARGSVSP